MIANAGLAALWLAAGLAALQIVLALRGTEAAGAGRAVAIVQTVLVAFGLSVKAFEVEAPGEALLLAATAVAACAASARTSETVRPWAVAGWTMLTLDLAVRGEFSSGPIIYGTLALWLAATGLLHCRSRGGEPMLDRLLGGQLATWGALIAHVGAGVAVAGIAASLALTSERSANLRPGETVGVGPWLVQLDAVVPAAGPGWTAFEAALIASHGAGPVTLKPQSRFARGKADPASMPDRAALLSGDLQAYLGEGDDSGRWQVRVRWRPFAGWARIGGLIMALGGLVSLAHFVRIRPRRARVRYA